MVCFLQVLFRFVFNLPLAWTEELSRYVFIILIYCGASAAVLDLSLIHISYGIQRRACSEGKVLYDLLLLRGPADGADTAQ